MKRDDRQRLSNTARADMVDAVLEKKNSILREYRETGVPKAAFVPRSMKQYRLWEDVDMGLSPLGSPNSINIKDSKPERVELIKEASSLIVRLRSALPAPRKTRLSHEQLYKRDQAEIKRLKNLTRGMAAAIQQLKQELETTQTGYDQMVADYTNLRKEMGELRRSVVKQSRIRLVRNENNHHV
jgi:hypothetical protein